MTLTIKDKLRLNHIQRWNMIPSVYRQSVAGHTYGVCIILDEAIRMTRSEVYADSNLVKLLDSIEGPLMRAALHHDLVESLTGDVPSCSKNSEISNFKVFEKQLQHKTSFRYPEYDCLIKIADIIEARWFIRAIPKDKQNSLIMMELYSAYKDIKEQIYQHFTGHDSLPNELKYLVSVMLERIDVDLEQGKETFLHNGKLVQR
jgi:hypothetical protein